MFGPRTTLQPQLRFLGTPSKSVFRLTSRPSRYTSTTAAHVNTNANAPGPSPSQFSKWLRRLAYAGIFGGLGMLAGSRIEEKLALPLVPGTQEDTNALGRIQQVFDVATPIVLELRNNPDYEESDVYGNYSEEDKSHRLTSGPLRGSRGLAIQKIFWNEKEKEAISVVYLGAGLEGWPTMVHGGATGIVIDENLGRVALRTFPERTGVTANLNVNYRAPVYSDHFYTFHSRLDQERSTDRKAFVRGEVRDPLGGLCVEATGIFVVPKNLKLQKVGEKY